MSNKSPIYTISLSHDSNECVVEMSDEMKEVNEQFLTCVKKYLINFGKKRVYVGDIRKECGKIRMLGDAYCNGNNYMYTHSFLTDLRNQIKTYHRVDAVINCVGKIGECSGDSYVDPKQ